MKKIFENAGFNVQVSAIGYGPFSAAFLMVNPFFSRNIVFRVIGVPIALSCVLLDILISNVRPKFKKRYALGYLVSARKPTVI